VRLQGREIFSVGRIKVGIMEPNLKKYGPGMKEEEGRRLSQ
jgi:hypothetical protein